MTALQNPDMVICGKFFFILPLCLNVRQQLSVKIGSKNLSRANRSAGYFLLLVFTACLVLLLFQEVGIRHQDNIVSAETSQKEGFQKAGQYGDSFGYVNSLFSGLAFGGIIVALVIQALEFGLAATERREQLEAQERISEQQKIASQISAIQTLIQVNSWRRIDRELCKKNRGYLVAVVENARLRNALEKLTPKLETEPTCELSSAKMKSSIVPPLNPEVQFNAAHLLADLIYVCQRVNEITPNNVYGPVGTRMPIAEGLLNSAVERIWHDKPILDCLERCTPGLHQQIHFRKPLLASEAYFRNSFGPLVEGYNPPDYIAGLLDGLEESALNAISTLTGTYFDKVEVPQFTQTAPAEYTK